MKAIDFPFQAIDTFTFAQRPQPISASLRPIYRVSLIVLILKINCRNQTASLLKLQFFNWMLKSPSLQNIICENLTTQNVFPLPLIHLDPMVNLALKYAFADNLIIVTKSSKYKLTQKGDELASRIMQDTQTVLRGEIKLLNDIGQKISEPLLRKKLL